MSGPPARGALWKWGGLGIAGALVLLGLGVWSAREEGPPPPMPLHPPEALPGVPVLPQHPPEPSRAPPAAPPVKSLDEEPSEEARRRREAFEAVPSVPERRAPPLRRKDPGISPKTLSRQNLGRSVGKGLAHVLLVSTFQGKDVSAPVEIDGMWRGNTPLSITVPAGDHLIRIDHGRTRVNEFLTTLEGGRSIRMEVDLRPASEARGNKKKGKSHHP